MTLRRREIVALIAGVAGWPLCGLAEQPELTRHVGVLMFFPEDDPEGQRWVSALKGALQQLSWIDGKNLHLELRWVADPSLVAKYAAELVSLTPDIILTTNTTTTKAVQQVSSAVPIVFVGVSDPASTGVVASLAKPGANATGFANLEFAIGGKWLELLKEIAPYVEQAHVILDANNPTGRWHLQTIESAAPAFGIVVTTSLVRDRDEIGPAFATISNEPTKGLIILPGPVNNGNRERIIAFAHSQQIPAIFPSRYHIVSGGLISYGVDGRDQYRRAASYIDRILKGEKPGGLPVQQPTKFELVINLKTAKALGLTVPPSLLARADELIE